MVEVVMAEAITVLIADDHAVVRAGLANILATDPDIKIIGEAKDGLEAIEKAIELKPDVILMDIFMPRCSGLEATAAIKQKLADARLLILTVSDREEDLVEALRLGAKGYLLKSASIDEVVEAVRKTADNESMLSPDIATKLVTQFNGNAHKPKLSAREAEILQLLGDGLSNTEIANRLFIDESTVRTHLRRIREKLNLKSRAAAIVYVARNHVTHQINP
jgi:DNA-binding NarL/FixJ family response regulator